MQLGISQEGERFPQVDIAKGSNWSHKFTALTNSILLGLKVNSV